MAYIVSLLPFLACPLMMGLMFWLMRGNTDQSAEQTHQTRRTTANESMNAPRQSAMNGLHLCLNWKVVAGLAVVGLGIWAVAPGLVWAALPVLVILACPLSMLFMMRGIGGGQCATQPAREQLARNSATDERLAESRADHAAIVREIAALEDASVTTGPTSALDAHTS